MYSQSGDEGLSILSRQTEFFLESQHLLRQRIALARPPRPALGVPELPYTSLFDAMKGIDTRGVAPDNHAIHDPHSLPCNSRRLCEEHLPAYDISDW